MASVGIWLCASCGLLLSQKHPLLSLKPSMHPLPAVVGVAYSVQSIRRIQGHRNMSC